MQSGFPTCFNIHFLLVHLLSRFRPRGHLAGKSVQLQNKDIGKTNEASLCVKLRQTRSTAFIWSKHKNSKHKKSNEPIIAQRRHLQAALSTGKRMQQVCLAFVANWSKKWREIFQPITKRNKIIPTVSLANYLNN